MHVTESAEMYLENILVLRERKGEVRAIDVAHYSGYSKPSVSRAMSLLKNAGHITVDADGFISLTDSGRAIAEKILERHHILTEYLIRLGVDPDTASQDACKIEHYLSDSTFDAMKRHSEELK